MHAAIAKFECVHNLQDIDDIVVGLADDAAECVRMALSDTESRALFAPAVERTEVWREMPFEWVNGSDWVTGRFDRVLVRRSDTGRIVSGLLIDFKTAGKLRVVAHDAFDCQMELYRSARAALCKIPLSAVEAKVILLQPGRVQTRSVKHSRPLGAPAET